MQKRILTVGEPMGLFMAEEEGLLEDARHFSASVAGAEFNVAVGLTRLGHHVGYLTKLGKDPFGRQIIKMMNADGIDTSMTMSVDEYRTGFMLKAKTSTGDPDIYYYRKNSAASTISPEDVQGLDLNSWDALHTTGILPATSDTAHAASLCLMKKAREAGKKIFFDPNLRPQLWKDEATMISSINELASYADVVMPGVGEGRILTGSENPEKIAAFYLKYPNVTCVVVKVGADGACAYTRDRKLHVPSYQHGPIVDTVGAGDGFAAGFESAVLEGKTLEEALRRGNAIGTIQIMNPSDNEGLPTREELEKFMKETPLNDV